VTDPFLRHIRLQVPVLSRDDAFIFFGNRKVGLQSVCRHLLKDRVVLWKDNPQPYKQRWRSYTMEDIGRMFKFTIVRNPWDRVVSAFSALQQTGYKRKIAPDEDFKNFVKGPFHRDGVALDLHFEHQHPRAFFEGMGIVDFVARMERIDDDWPVVAKAIECSSVLPHKNKSSRGSYGDYYDDECRDIVAQIYEKDIELFGYEFGQGSF